MLLILSLTSLSLEMVVKSPLLTTPVRAYRAVYQACFIKY